MIHFFDYLQSRAGQNFSEPFCASNASELCAAGDEGKNRKKKKKRKNIRQQVRASYDPGNGDDCE